MTATLNRTAVAWMLPVMGNQLANQNAVNVAIQQMPQDTQDGLVAKASGTQTNGTPLIIGFNRVITVGSANDTCTLPPSYAGAACTLVNDDASNSLQLFGCLLNPATNAGDTIDGVTSGTGNAVAAGKRLELKCYTTGKWISSAGTKTS